MTGDFSVVVLPDGTLKRINHRSMVRDLQEAHFEANDYKKENISPILQSEEKTTLLSDYSNQE